jgi:predicted DNA-binding transcriptional regulator AlpA
MPKLTQNPDEGMLLTAVKTRQRYGNVTEMTLYRWERDAKFDFPKPVRINSRKYFRLSELQEWERRQVGAKAA